MGFFFGFNIWSSVARSSLCSSIHPLSKPYLHLPTASHCSRSLALSLWKMSHFGRAGPPDIRDTYSLLVLNITFSETSSHSPSLSLSLSLCVCVCVCGSVNLDLQWCVLIGTTADDLYPLFDRYGKVVDVFIPRDRRLGLPLGLPFGFLYSPVYPVCFNNLLVWYDLVAHLMCLCDWCRTGESRGFAFVRYKYQDEAQKAVEKLDGFWFYIFQFFILMN